MVERIESDPNICNGKAVVKGTRITVASILDFLASGDSIDDVLASYPKLERADVLACLNYAKNLAEFHTTIRKSG